MERETYWRQWISPTAGCRSCYDFDTCSLLASPLFAILSRWILKDIIIPLRTSSSLIKNSWLLYIMLWYIHIIYISYRSYRHYVYTIYYHIFTSFAWYWSFTTPNDPNPLHRSFSFGSATVELRRGGAPPYRGYNLVATDEAGKITLTTNGREMKPENRPETKIGTSSEAIFLMNWGVPGVSVLGDVSCIFPV